METGYLMVLSFILKQKTINSEKHWNWKLVPTRSNLETNHIQN